MEARLTLQVQHGFPLAKAQLDATGLTPHLQKPTLNRSMAPLLKGDQPVTQAK